MTDVPNPSHIFESLNAHQKTGALRGAIELDLFSAIARGARSADAIAAACGADSRAMRILCDYLVAHELLTKSAGEYALTPSAAVFLDKQSPAYLGGIVKFINSPDLMNAFADIAEVVRRGGTLLENDGTTAANYDGWVAFARGMAPMMLPQAQFIGALAKELKDGPVRVLDVAAGHGMFGIMVAGENPQAQIVALDWEPVLAVAGENAAAAGITDRHSLLPGDALQVDFGEGFDIVLLTNFLHHFDKPTCEKVARKAHACLNDDGLAITLEFIPDEDRVAPPHAATFAMTMLATTPSGDAYTFAEYDAIFRAAGFAHNEPIDVPDTPQRIVVSRR